MRRAFGLAGVLFVLLLCGCSSGGVSGGEVTGLSYERATALAGECFRVDFVDEWEREGFACVPESAWSDVQVGDDFGEPASAPNPDVLRVSNFISDYTIPVMAALLVVVLGGATLVTILRQ